MDCPLYIAGRQAGVLRVTGERGGTRFTVRAAADAGLYRLYARGERSDLLLGTWEGCAMSRLFSREITEPAGRIFSAVAYSLDTEEAWLPARKDRFLRWPVTSGLCRRRRKGVELALPFDEDGPFPLPELFCFAGEIRLSGREYAVFTFDEQGRPVFPIYF